MNKGLLIAASVLAFGTAACSKSGDANSSGNVSAEDNMLVPADENSMGADANAGMTGDTDTAANGMAGDNATMATDNSMAANGTTNGM